MTRMGIIVAGVVFVVMCQMANAIDYKKNTIAGGGVTNRSVFMSFSSSSTGSGSNVTTITSSDSMQNVAFGDFDWSDRGFGKKTLDQRIRDAEQKIRDAEQRLNKLVFIRDVCRKLEDEIRISFEKKDIREVLAQVSEIIGMKLPYEVPEGTYLVEKSDVAGMPTDQFLSSMAGVCGLTLKYERSKLVFQKPEKTPSSQPPEGAR